MAAALGLRRQDPIRESRVQNLRVARQAELRLGRQWESMGVEELADDAKPPILREYLRHWKMETGKFFDGVTATYTRIGTPANRSWPSRVQGNGPEDSLIARIMGEGSGPGMTYERGR
jgi:hypothetical protein